MKFHVFISKFSIKAFMKHCIKTNKITLGGFLELIRVQTLPSVMACWQPEIKNDHNNKFSLAYYSNS